MGNLTANVSDYEFKCKCVDSNCYYKDDYVADFRLVTALQKITDHFKTNYKNEKVTLVITSGNRCCIYNAQVGGKPYSKHTKGLAADFQIKIGDNVLSSYMIANYIATSINLKIFDYYNIDNNTIHLEIDKD